MTTLVNRKDREYQEQGFLQFSEAELDKLTITDISRIKEHFQGYALMKLPDAEIAFFEWLKINDRPVWDDLWAEEAAEYMVSIDLLDHFMHPGNGFPICDLVDETNYWFTARMIKPKGRELFPEIEEKLSGDKKLTFDEALLVEIMQGPIDVWHFCYRYKISIAFAKSRIDHMQHEDLLVHLHDREDLVKYIDF